MGDAMAAWAAGGADALSGYGAAADAPYAPSSALEGAIVRAIIPRVTDPATAELRSPADCADAALVGATAPCLAPLLPEDAEKSTRAKKVMYAVSGAYVVVVQ